MIQVLTVVLVGLLPTYIVRFPLFGVPTNFFEVGVWSVFLAALCAPGARRQLMRAIRGLPRSVIFWALLFVTAAIISTLYSPVLRSSLGILKGWVITPMVFGLLVYTAKKSDPFAYKKIIRSLIYSGLVVALLGMSQLNGFMRIMSMYDVPNSLALFLAPIFMIALWVGIRMKERFYIYSALIMLIAIIGTQSFGVILAILVPLCVGVFLSKAKLRITHYGMVLGVFMLVIVVFFLSGRVSYLVSPFMHENIANSATVRLQLWDVGIRLIQKHPILGVGLGQFEGAYQEELHKLFVQRQESASLIAPYKLAPEFVFRDPHNWAISFWLNVGFLGLLSFIALNVIVLTRTKEYFSAYGEGAYYAQAIFLGIVAILIFGLFDTIYWKNDLSALWWMLLIYGVNGAINKIDLKS